MDKRVPMPRGRKRSFAASTTREVKAKQLSPLLDGAQPRTVRQITDAATLVELPRRAIVYETGQLATGLYVLLDGRVKLSLPLADPRERVVAILEPGTWFGASALVLRQAYADTASTVEPAILAKIPAAIFLDCLRRDRSFATKVLVEAFRRLHTALVDTAAISISARERVVRWLLDEAARAHARGDRAEIVLRTTKAVLASRLHMTAAHLSRMFHELKDANLIEVKARRISVPSVARLRGEYSGDQRPPTRTLCAR